MSPVAEELKTTLSALSRSEQAELALYLIRQLDDDGHDEGYEEAWAAEIDARRAEVISGKDLGVDSDEAIARARALLA